MLIDLEYSQDNWGYSITTNEIIEVVKAAIKDVEFEQSKAKSFFEIKYEEGHEYIQPPQALPFHGAKELKEKFDNED